MPHYVGSCPAEICTNIVHTCAEPRCVHCPTCTPPNQQYVRPLDDPQVIGCIQRQNIAPEVAADVLTCVTNRGPSLEYLNSTLYYCVDNHVQMDSYSVRPAVANSIYACLRDDMYGLNLTATTAQAQSDDLIGYQFGECMGKTSFDDFEASSCLTCILHFWESDLTTVKQKADMRKQQMSIVGYLRERGAACLQTCLGRKISNQGYYAKKAAELDGCLANMTGMDSHCETLAKIRYLNAFNWRAGSSGVAAMRAFDNNHTAMHEEMARAMASAQAALPPGSGNGLLHLWTPAPTPAVAVSGNVTTGSSGNVTTASSNAGQNATTGTSSPGNASQFYNRTYDEGFQAYSNYLLLAVPRGAVQPVIPRFVPPPLTPPTSRGRSRSPALSPGRSMSPHEYVENYGRKHAGPALTDEAEWQAAAKASPAKTKQAAGPASPATANQTARPASPTITSANPSR